MGSAYITRSEHQLKEASDTTEESESSPCAALIVVVFVGAVLPFAVRFVPTAAKTRESRALPPFG